MIHKASHRHNAIRLAVSTFVIQSHLSLVTDGHGPYIVHSRVSSSFSRLAPEIQLTNESHNSVTYIIIVRRHTHQEIDMFAIFLKYCLRLFIPYIFVKHHNEFIKSDSKNLIFFTYNPRQSRVWENRNHVKQMLYDAWFKFVFLLQKSCRADFPEKNLSFITLLQITFQAWLR